MKIKVEFLEYDGEGSPDLESSFNIVELSTATVRHFLENATMETILLEQVSRTPQVALSEIGTVLSCIHPDHVKGFEFDVFEDSVTVKVSEAAFDALAIKARLHVESFRYHSHEIWQAQLGGVTIRTIRPVGASRTAGDDLSGCVVYP